MTRTEQAPSPAPRGPARFRAPEEVQEPRSVGRAVAAGVALLLLVVGVPLGLWAVTGPPPFPTGLPSREDLTQPVGIETILVLLRLVVWLAWLQFVVSVVVEAVPMVRGRGLPRHVPFGGLSQQLARTLVSALLIGGVVVGGSTSASAVTAAEGVGGPETSVTQVVQADEEAPTVGSEDRTGPASDAGPGAGVRVAHAGVPATMTDVIGKVVYVVQPPKGHYHDNLWDIAERHLGDGRRWNEIFRLNDGREQPDGRQLVIGRLIQPGWVLVMPDDATGLQRVQKAPESAASPVPRGGETGGDTAGADTLGAEGAAGEVAGGEGSASVGSAARPALPPDLLLGGLLSAGLLGALAAERRRRRGGSGAPEAAEAEVALRVGADESRAGWLDRALRGLSTTCRDQQVALPPVFAAVVDEEQVDVHLAPARPEAPAPWTPIDEGRIWRLHRDDEEATEPGHAPFPGLVCLGRDADGRDVLLDLESVGGAVSVAGDDRLAGEVVSALAVQLATNPWVDEQQVVGHHLAPVLAEVAGDRMLLVDDVSPLLDEVERSRPDRGAGEVLSGRLGRRPGLVPSYLVTGSQPEGDLAEHLGRLTATGGRGFGVVVAGSMPGVRLDVDESGTLSVPLLDVQVAAVRLTQSSAEHLATLFAAARSEAPTPPEGRPPVTAPGRRGDDAHWSAASVRVGVLGPVATRAAGSIDPTRVDLATEIVTFLALQPGPVHPSVLGASVWPRGVTPEVRDATVERVREWLGVDVDGHHHLRADEAGRLWLGEAVALDWAAFCDLSQRARGASSPREEGELLRRALHLVRGGFLEDRPSGRYAWLARTSLERDVPGLVVDTAHRLAELCRQEHDPGGAAGAAEAGLRLASGEQLLWRDLLRSEFDQGGTEAAAVVAGRMAEELARRGVPVEAETDALVEELVPRGTLLSG